MSNNHLHTNHWVLFQPLQPEHYLQPPKLRVARCWQCYIQAYHKTQVFHIPWFHILYLIDLIINSDCDLRSFQSFQLYCRLWCLLSVWCPTAVIQQPNFKTQRSAAGCQDLLWLTIVKTTFLSPLSCCQPIFKQRTPHPSRRSKTRPITSQFSPISGQVSKSNKSWLKFLPCWRKRRVWRQELGRVGQVSIERIVSAGPEISWKVPICRNASKTARAELGFVS